jgi:hypothetical protein
MLLEKNALVGAPIARLNDFCSLDQHHFPEFANKAGGTLLPCPVG